MKTDAAAALKRKQKLQKLIEKHGSAYAASIAEGITPQAFYERMDRVGLKAHGYRRLFGEPKGKVAKRKWLRTLLKECGSVAALSRRLGRSYTATRERLQRLGIDTPSHLHRGEPEDLRGKKRWMKALLKKHGNACKVAKVLKVSPQAVYERVDRYGL